MKFDMLPVADTNESLLTDFLILSASNYPGLEEELLKLILGTGIKASIPIIDHNKFMIIFISFSRNPNNGKRNLNGLSVCFLTCFLVYVGNFPRKGALKNKLKSGIVFPKIHWGTLDGSNVIPSNPSINFGVKKSIIHPNVMNSIITICMMTHIT